MLAQGAYARALDEFVAEWDASPPLQDQVLALRPLRIEDNKVT